MLIRVASSPLFPNHPNHPNHLPNQVEVITHQHLPSLHTLCVSHQHPHDMMHANHLSLFSSRSMILKYSLTTNSQCQTHHGKKWRLNVSRSVLLFHNPVNTDNKDDHLLPRRRTGHETMRSHHRRLRTSITILYRSRSTGHSSGPSQLERFRNEH